MTRTKTKSKIERLLKRTLIALFVMTVSSEAIAQEKNSADLKEFKITIEKTDNGLKMQSDNGSAWIDLSFSLSNNKPQAIDEYGMTQLGKVANNKDPKLADYLFTITKTKDGITLTGIEGTAWKELSFTLQKNGRQAIDQFGMTE
ncbi:hypothetical protein MMU07_08090 [Aquiflexum sp. LQ15W]|uniref:hypothetical protein n=1 Tax=Cognataquiflexum nitidum TaxID=2922272 RepID=UPI001F13525C|nr:hypothetical protein [Cognataquiflexum nitidum]MCH6199534.1 hypothetical protein [Cognataquiflexum nitidum]